jgi:hypothetical protein
MNSPAELEHAAFPGSVLTLDARISRSVTFSYTTNDHDMLSPLMFRARDLSIFAAPAEFVIGVTADCSVHHHGGNRTIEIIFAMLL